MKAPKKCLYEGLLLYNNAWLYLKLIATWLYHFIELYVYTLPFYLHIGTTFKLEMVLSYPLLYNYIM